MNSGILERIRLREEDIEKCVDSIVQQMLLREEVTNDRHKLLIDHFVAAKLQEITATADQLADMYLDEDEIVEARNAPSEGKEVVAAAFKAFEGRMADIREHRTTPAHRLPAITYELAKPNPKTMDEIFSPGERYGRCLHLEEHYQRYSRFVVQTITLGSRCQLDGDLTQGLLLSDIRMWSAEWGACEEYLPFVSSVASFILRDIPAHRKIVGFKHYREWIEGLLGYLEDFYKRLNPLLEDNLETELKEVEGRAEAYWEALFTVEEIPWASGAPPSSSSPRVAPSIHVKKSSGLAVPSKLQKYLDHFSLWPMPFLRTLFGAKGLHQTSDETVRNAPKSEAEVKAVIFMEGKITAILKTLLFKTHQQTESFLKRSQSKTLEELEKERLEDDAAFEESLKKSTKHAQNTLEGTIAQAAQYHLKAAEELGKMKAMEEQQVKADEDSDEEGLSLQAFVDEDGNPIPRWLAKQQQLDKTYSCEVCGGTFYRGPKRFREHFGGERHGEGLRCIGVTEHLKLYEGLTSIREVIKMRNKLEQTMVGMRKRLRQEKELEEIQDDSGKVVTEGEYAHEQEESPSGRSAHTGTVKQHTSNDNNFETRRRTIPTFATSTRDANRMDSVLRPHTFTPIWFVHIPPFLFLFLSHYFQKTSQCTQFFAIIQPVPLYFQELFLLPFIFFFTPPCPSSMETTFSTVVFCDARTGATRSLRVPVSPASCTVRRLAKSALQRLVAILGSELSEESKSSLGVTYVYLQDPKFPDCKVELFLQDTLSHVVDIKEEVVYLSLSSPSGVLQPAAGTLPAEENLVKACHSSGVDECSNSNSNSCTLPRAPSAPETAPAPAQFTAVAESTPPNSATPVLPVTPPTVSPAVVLQSSAPLPKPAFYSSFPPAAAVETRIERKRLRESAFTSPSEPLLHNTPFTPSAAKVSPLESQLDRGHGAAAEAAAARALQFEEISDESTHLSQPTGGEEAPVPAIQQSLSKLRWGSKAAESFDPETYCDDPTKARLPASKLRSPYYILWGIDILYFFRFQGNEEKERQRKHVAEVKQRLPFNDDSPMLMGFITVSVTDPQKRIQKQTYIQTNTTTTTTTKHRSNNIGLQGGEKEKEIAVHLPLMIFAGEPKSCLLPGLFLFIYHRHLVFVSSMDLPSVHLLRVQLYQFTDREAPRTVETAPAEAQLHVAEVIQKYREMASTFAPRQSAYRGELLLPFWGGDTFADAAEGLSWRLTQYLVKNENQDEEVPIRVVRVLHFLAAPDTPADDVAQEPSPYDDASPLPTAADEAGVGVRCVFGTFDLPASCAAAGLPPDALLLAKVSDTAVTSLSPLFWPMRRGAAANEEVAAPVTRWHVSLPPTGADAETGPRTIVRLAVGPRESVLEAVMQPLLERRRLDALFLMDPETGARVLPCEGAWAVAPCLPHLWVEGVRCKPPPTPDRAGGAPQDQHRAHTRRLLRERRHWGGGAAEETPEGTVISCSAASNELRLSGNVVRLSVSQSVSPRRGAAMVDLVSSLPRSDQTRTPSSRSTPHPTPQWGNRVAPQNTAAEVSRKRGRDMDPSAAAVSPSPVRGVLASLGPLRPSQTPRSAIEHNSFGFEESPASALRTRSPIYRCTPEGVAAAPVPAEEEEIAVEEAETPTTSRSPSVRSTQPALPPAPLALGRGVSADRLQAAMETVPGWRGVEEVGASAQRQPPPPAPVRQWQRISPMLLFSSSRGRGEELFSLDSSSLGPPTALQGSCGAAPLQMLLQGPEPIPFSATSDATALEGREAVSAVQWEFEGEEEEEDGGRMVISQHHFTIPVDWETSSSNESSVHTMAARATESDTEDELEEEEKAVNEMLYDRGCATAVYPGAGTGPMKERMDLHYDLLLPFHFLRVSKGSSQKIFHKKKKARESVHFSIEWCSY
eukprot:gene5937-4246_t